MKQILLMIAVVALVGCGKKEPVQPSPPNSTTPSHFEETKAKGDAMAQYNLGVMYVKGQGVLEDYVAAYAWCNIAAANGSAFARKNKPLLAKEMTRDQIAEAQKLSRELLRRIEANKAGKPKPSDLFFGRPLVDPDTGLPIIRRR